MIGHGDKLLDRAQAQGYIKRVQENYEELLKQVAVLKDRYILIYQQLSELSREEKQSAYDRLHALLAMKQL